MTESKIVLPSTHKGYFSQYFWGLLWGTAFLCFALWCSGYIESIYAALKVNSWNEFHNTWGHGKYWMIDDFPLLHAGMIVSYVIAGIIYLCKIYTMIYSTRMVSVFFQGKEGLFNKLTCNTYNFPFSKTANQIVFDRITHINISQSSICRILNTGSLTVTMITFTNADSKEQSWKIPAIKDPYARKAELEKALLAHEGLTVKLAQKEEFATKNKD